jgi:hypothetical protein
MANHINAWPTVSINTQISATLAPPSLSAVWLKNRRCQYERDGVGGVGEPPVGPTAIGEQERGERGHGAEADAAECGAKTRYPHPPEHFGEREAVARHGYDGGNRSDEQQRHQRSQRRDERDRDETVAGVERGANRRADREGGEHRGPHPSDDLAGVPGIDDRQSPTDRGSDDKTFRSSEHGSPEQ